MNFCGNHRFPSRLPDPMKKKAHSARLDLVFVNFIFFFIPYSIYFLYFDIYHYLFSQDIFLCRLGCAQTIYFFADLPKMGTDFPVVRDRFICKQNSTDLCLLKLTRPIFREKPILKPWMVRTSFEIGAENLLNHLE